MVLGFFFAQKAELNFRLPDIGYFFMFHFSSLFSCFFPSFFSISFPFNTGSKRIFLPHSSISFPFFLFFPFPLFSPFLFLPVPLSLFSLFLFCSSFPCFLLSFFFPFLYPFSLCSCFAPLSLVSSFPFSLFLSLFFPSEIQNKFKIINPSSHSVYRKAYAYIPISSSLWIEPLYRNLRTTMLNFPGFRVEFVPASYALF